MTRRLSCLLHELHIRRERRCAIAAVMGAGSNASSLDRLLALFDPGDFDLIAVDHGMLVNADWTNKVREGRLD